MSQELELFIALKILCKKMVFRSEPTMKRLILLLFLLLASCLSDLPSEAKKKKEKKMRDNIQACIGSYLLCRNSLKDLSETSADYQCSRGFTTIQICFGYEGM